jgi:hypothetical protein
MSKYALVEFLENGERSVAIVPYIWVVGKECWWPNKPSKSWVMSCRPADDKNGQFCPFSKIICLSGMEIFNFY